MDKNKSRTGKLIGMILVLIAFLLIGYGIHVLVGSMNPEVADNGADIQTDTKEIMQDQGSNDGVTERGETGKTEPTSFDTIESILSYDIPEGVAERLNVVAFDAALVKYLREENLISTASGEESAYGLYKVTTDGLITEDVNHDVFCFDLVIDDGNRTTLTAAVGSDHEYTFSR